MSVTLDFLLERLACWLDNPAVEEICVQRPGEIWVYARGYYEQHLVPELDEHWIEDIAIVAAAQREQDIWRGAPPLDTDLDGRGRINAIFPPLVARGFPCLTIRRGGNVWLTLEDQRKSGTFRRAREKLSRATNQNLIDLYQRGMAAPDDDERSLLLEQFFIGAVRARLTIIGAGVTASGKTAFIKSCTLAINPYEHVSPARIVTW